MPLPRYSLSLIQTLQPPVQPIATAFLDRCAAAGIPCEVAQGARSFSEQQAIYDQGRTTPGSIVTKARPGDSYHQYGLAFDVVPVAYKSLSDWNPTGPHWAAIGQIGEALGLTWGGRWVTPDKPHFELKAAPLDELKAYWAKFQKVMPIQITPSMGAGAIILVIGVLYFFWLRPMLARRGYV